MNEIFSFRRFGRYFVHDLRNAANRYWLSIIVLGLMPFTIFVFYLIISFLMDGGTGFNLKYADYCRVPAVLIAAFVCMLNFPVKVYGDITDRKAGSSWLVLPSSTFEKWLSMVLTVTLVLPLVLTVLVLGTDALLTLAFGENGSSALSWLMKGNEWLASESNGFVDFNLPLVLITEWVGGIMSYLLGAIFFKKAKIAKTILVGVLWTTLLSCVMVSVCGTVQIDDEFVRNFGAERFAHRLKSLFVVYYSLINAALLALTYVRLRTIKH